VAAGRLDAWIQTDPAPWDWLPGAVLVAEAAGVAAGLGDEAGWHVAASSPQLHAQIARVLTA
jgi:fructose-1,6-bisphosphatase/inositol monophosphatase family enzyme